jgi:hypothetical protein
MAARLLPVKSLGTSIVASCSARLQRIRPPRRRRRECRRIPAPSTSSFQANFQEYSPYWRQVGSVGRVKGQLLQTLYDARELNTVMFL